MPESEIVQKILDDTDDSRPVRNLIRNIYETFVNKDGLFDTSYLSVKADALKKKEVKR